LAPADDATVMPVYPLPTIEWPGSEVELNVTDPAYVRMYQELLEAGQRRLVAPLLRSSAGATNTADRWLHSMAAVLYVEELTVAEADADGAVAYRAKHKVIGRANILRLLNPSALFQTALGANASCLRAEVDVIPDPHAEIVQTATAKQLMQSLEELRKLSERLHEPRLQNEEIIKQSVLTTSTWQLVSLWQRLQIASRTYRARAHVNGVLRDWIEGQQSAGRLPTPLPDRIDIGELNAPASVVEAFMGARDPAGIDLGSEFWDRLLSILAAKDAEERWRQLLEWTREEVNLALARAAVRDVLG